MPENLTEFEKSIHEARMENLKQLLILIDYDLYKDIFIHKECEQNFINTLLQYISD